MKKLLMMIGAAAVAATGANAASVTIDSVVQRWPWNNKIDITYTVTDGQTLTADPTNDVYMRLVFTATIGGNTYTIDGNTIGASATGSAVGTQHTVTWTPPTDLKVKASGCTMSASLYAADAPSGDDYMVIDLEETDSSKAVKFEGMLYSQELSNSRYNSDTSGPAGTNVYKTTKLVLRKVPRWADRASLPNAASKLAALSGYPTGSSDTYSNFVNTPTNWATKADYYISVFPVTQAQYTGFGLTNPSAYTSSTTLPVESMSYNILRFGTRAGTALPTVDSRSEGSFFQRLNYATGNTFAFDLPTEVMWEIACRAGSTGKWYWDSDATPSDYVVYNKGTSGTTEEVGGKLPNDWGLYDMVGNVYSFCLDDYAVKKDGGADMAANAGVFDPVSVDSWSRVSVRGIVATSSDDKYLQASYRNFNGNRDNTAKIVIGFRVACVMK